MTLLFMDSFDHYATADLQAKYPTAVAGGTGIWAGGRKTNCFGGTSNQDWYLPKTVPGQHTTLILGFAMYLNSIRPDTSMFAFTQAGSTQFNVAMNSSYHMYVAGQYGSTIIATGRWYYVEFKTTFHNSTGSWELRLNGNTEISGSNYDTSFTGNAWGDGFIFQSSYYVGSGNGYNYRIDDLYFADDQGSVNNNFMGDLRVETILPNANGSHSDFVGSDSNSTDNYLLVDEATPNGDTDYVESSTVNAIDTYNMASLAASAGTIYGVQLLPYAKKSDAGTRTMKSVARLSATEEDSASAFTLTDNYTYYPEIRETKPGGGAWSLANVNAMEAGVKVIS